MTRIRWTRILAVLAVIVAIARWKDVRAMLLSAADFLKASLAIVWQDTGPSGRAIIVISLLGLGYATAAIWVKQWIRGRSQIKEKDRVHAPTNPSKKET